MGHSYNFVHLHDVMKFPLSVLHGCTSAIPLVTPWNCVVLNANDFSCSFYKREFFILAKYLSTEIIWHFLSALFRYIRDSFHYGRILCSRK